VEFTQQEDGFKDTTITIELYSLILDNSDSDIPRYAISNRSSGDIVAEGELSFLDSKRFNYTAGADILTTTTSVEGYTVNVFFESNSQVYAQTGLIIKGFSNFAPVAWLYGN
jgi:hypothetical protein